MGVHSSPRRIVPGFAVGFSNLSIDLHSVARIRERYYSNSILFHLERRLLNPLESTAHHAEATDRRLAQASETCLMLFSVEYGMGLFDSTSPANSLPQPRQYL